ncbi:MAG: DUF805 domain-containing protein [Bacteroidota bacterium]
MLFWYREVLSKYADFSGRARRREFWMFHLANLVIVLPVLVLGVVSAEMLGEGSGLVVTWGLYAFYGIYVLAMFIPQLAVSVRRLHDLGKSGWWMLLTFVPFGSWVLLVFFVQDGTDGDNVYGPDPKGFADLRKRVDELAGESYFSDNVYEQSARYRAI